MTMLGAGGGEWMLLEDVKDLADWAEASRRAPSRMKWVEEFAREAEEAALEAMI